MTQIYDELVSWLDKFKESSKKNYISTIGQFFKSMLYVSLEDVTDEELAKVDKEMIYRYIDALSIKHTKKGTITPNTTVGMTKVRRVRSFFEELSKSRDWLNVEAIFDFEKRSESYHVPTKEEVQRMIDLVLIHKDFKTKRTEKALCIELIASTGISMDDAKGIRLNDLESKEDGSTFVVIDGKRIALDESLFTKLKTIRKNMSCNDRIFTSGSLQLRDAITAAGKHLGFDKTLTPSSLALSHQEDKYNLIKMMDRESLILLIMNAPIEVRDTLLENAKKTLHQ